jgi:hypothetical protein
MQDDKKTKDRDEDRMESYPRPSRSDINFNNQPEFIDQQPNDFHDKSISDLPANEEVRKESNEPEEK